MRLADWVRAFRDASWEVRVLLPGKSAITDAALEAGVQVCHASTPPFCRDMPGEAPFRQFMVRCMMTPCAARIVAFGACDLLLGIDDGAAVALSAMRLCFKKSVALLADVTKGYPPSRCLRRTLPRASAIVAASDAIRKNIEKTASRARMCTIGEPRDGFAGIGELSFREFAEAAGNVAQYALEMHSLKMQGKNR